MKNLAHKLFSDALTIVLSMVILVNFPSYESETVLSWIAQDH